MKDMKGHKIFIGGIQGSGKTHAAKFIIKTHFKKAIGLRVTPDFDDIENIKLIESVGSGPEKLRSDLEELAGMLVEDGKQVMEKKKALPDFDVLIIDEFDLMFRANADLTPNLNDLMLMHRHYKISIIMIKKDFTNIFCNTFHVLMSNFRCYYSEFTLKRKAFIL